MANQKNLEKKQAVIDEISEKTKKANSVILFEYQGLTVEDTNALRRLLKETNSELKIYKNTLVKRAFNSLNIDMDSELEGPKAIAFGEDAVAPIKTLSDFAKKHPELILKIGLVDGEIADEVKLKQLSTIPSREGLLTMLATGLMGTIKDLSICLDLYSEQIEKK